MSQQLSAAMYPHPFSKAYWRDAARELKDLRKLTFAALMIAGFRIAVMCRDTFGALLAGIMFFWVLKKETALDAVNQGSSKPIGSWFHPLGKWVYCPLCVVALVAGAILGGIG